MGNIDTKINNAHALCYIIKGQQQRKFNETLYYIITKTFQIKFKERGEVDIDEDLNRLLKGNTGTRNFEETLDEVIQITRRETCTRTNALKLKSKR